MTKNVEFRGEIFLAFLKTDSKYIDQEIQMRCLLIRMTMDKISGREIQTKEYQDDLAKIMSIAFHPEKGEREGWKEFDRWFDNKYNKDGEGHLKEKSEKQAMKND